MHQDLLERDTLNRPPGRRDHASPMVAVRLGAADDFDGFRSAVRGLVAAGIRPECVTWRLPGDAGLFGDPPALSDAALMLPAAFVPLARDVVCHREAERFALLYTAVWRLQHSERALLSVASDPLVHRLTRMQKAVRRDLHKMTAFVRFRRIEGLSEAAIGDAAKDHYVAWFEPEHHILRPAAKFFSERFAAMRWSIATPQGSIHWDGKSLAFGAGVARADAPTEDAPESWWLTYYRATFNPARANVPAMLAEMPKKYWRNLPEAPLIPGMLAAAGERTRQMIAAPAVVTRNLVPRTAKPMRDIVQDLLPAGAGDAPDLVTLAAQTKACERCPLFATATGTVFGEGPADAQVVFVGEQPGDQEDLAGRPFVGPAGQMFDRALAEIGIDRARVYVTNAVKHFKFVPRGKRRIHQKPNVSEIDHCRWWLDQELAAIAPRLTVALGATAARALTGRDVTIARERGRLQQFGAGRSGFITVHPSYLLRLPDREAQAAEYRRFVDDLAAVVDHVPSIRKVA